MNELLTIFEFSAVGAASCGLALSGAVLCLNGLLRTFSGPEHGIFRQNGLSDRQARARGQQP